MGVLDTLGNVVVKGVQDAFSPASLVTGALSFLGGERRNQQQADAAAAANAFSAQQYATRWQTTVKDMQAAGLNPMLAYQQGVGSQPTAQMAQFQDTISPAVASFQNQNLQESQVEANFGSAAQARANAALARKTVEKTTQEISNLVNANDQITAIIENLSQQTENLKQDNQNMRVINSNLVATTKKILSESANIDQQRLLSAAELKLKQLDIKAAESAGNLGREYQQVKPILDTIIHILRK